MFLPEDLLYKSGQLARVWLAANQHKKLTKAQVLQDKIDEDIEVIIRPEGAAGGPLALRLNGQLLLGVVRIYHRKAHYLHDDCNDALWKIKMVCNTYFPQIVITLTRPRPSVLETLIYLRKHILQTPTA
jgi:cohesin complex subunit SCC1